MSIEIGKLTEAIIDELTLYHEDIIESVKVEAKKSMNELVKETKKTAPVGDRAKHYKDNIKSRKTRETDREVEYTWYVDGSDYRLSHLLENGHALKNGGRVEGTHFIKKASEPIIEAYAKKIEEVCNGG